MPILELTVSLKKDTGTPLRVIGWWPKMGGIKVGIDANADTLPAILVIKRRRLGSSNSNNNEPDCYYLEVNLKRRPNTHDYTLEGGSIPLKWDMYGTEIKLNRRDDWFVSLYTKGTWDRATKRMSYSPNPWLSRQRVPAIKDDVWMERIDHPIHTQWIPFTLHNQDSDNQVLRFRPSVNSTLRLLPQGVIFSAGFRNRTNKRKSVRFVGLRSNVLSFNGYWSLSPNDLPALPARGTVGGGEPRWVATDTPNNQGLFDTGSCQMFQKNGVRHTPNPSENDSAANFNDLLPVIWAMPTETTGTPRTEFYGKDRWFDGRRTDDTGTTERTYWTSNRRPQHGSLRVSAIIQ